MACAGGMDGASAPELALAEPNSRLVKGRAG